METQKLQDAVVELIQKSTQFVEGQIPDVAAQLLAWVAFKYKAWMLIEFFICAALAMLCGLMWRWIDRDERGRRADEWAIPTIFIGFFSLVFLICAVSDLFSLMKILTAPKVWLMEYAVDLLPPPCRK